MDRISIKGQDMYVLGIEELSGLLDEKLLLERKLAYLHSLLDDIQKNYTNTPGNPINKLISGCLQEIKEMK